MSLRSLPTLADLQRTRRPVAKGATRLQESTAQTAVDRKADRQFRSAVWRRDEGRCRLCARVVRRTLTVCPEQGHVHHLRGRRVAPQDRYNPKAAILVCRSCHEQHHTGVVTVPR